jgi:SNF2 family DNA or RNA helicase
MLFDRFGPVVAIVGSSNFTGPGLSTNRELNLAHKVLLDESEVHDPDAELAVAWLWDERPSDKIKPKNKQLMKSEVGARAIIELESWYETQWSEAKDFKEDLISILDASKFGQMEYTPYQVYMKALYEYFKDDLGADIRPGIRSAVELSAFQEDAVKKARKILARYDGVMIGDSVGLGKTWIGKKLLEDFVYHLRQKALVICPASLRDMWMEELREASISTIILSQEELGQADFDVSSYGDVDVVLIDESHNFRNRSAQRYENLERLIAQNGGKGREGARKKIILITATPINNDLLDLYHQINLLTQGDRSYSSAAGIGDLYRYFLNARRDTRLATTMGLFNLLEEIVVRRTRAFIRRAYPEATISCERETPRVIPDGVDIFAIQEKVIEHILKSEEEKKAIEAAPKIVDPAQQLVATAIQEYLHHPEMDRNELVSLIGFISRPLPRIYGRKLREFYKEFSGNKDIAGLVEKVKKIKMESGKDEEVPAQKKPQALRKEDLHLICFDYLSA